MAGILAAAALAAAPGVIKAVGSTFGSGARKREERAAQRQLDQRRQAYESFEFKDPTAGMTNPFEDLTVNQQAAQFASQQQQQALAGTLGQLQGAAGSSGIAALAQSLAQQQSTNLQAAAASIGQQEAANQMARVQGQQQLEQARARGAQYVQGQEFERTETLLGMSQERLGTAKAARAQAKADLVGGIAEAAGAAAGAIAPGIGKGGGGGTPTPSLGNTTTPNIGQSFLNKTQGIVPQVPRLGKI